MQATAARRPGKGHRDKGIPCQDAYAVHVDADRRRAAAAVADGLGSRPLSHLGSQAACDAAVAHLATEPKWDPDALTRTFEAARAAVQAAADLHGVGLDDLATTLQVATLADGHVHAAMVGDGAIVAALADRPIHGGRGDHGGDDASSSAVFVATLDPALIQLQHGVRIVLEPPASEYANEVVPLTHAAWRVHLRHAELADVRSLLLFSDGLTRLLLQRSKAGWTPFPAFFEAFLPKLAGPPDPALAQRFLDSEAVDRSWDDDKCLVVLHADA